MARLSLADWAIGLAVLLALCGITGANKNFYIHWNTSNPIFQISNTDHIIDVNKGNNLFEYDQVTIICPEYTDRTKEEDTEKYIIYNVSKEEYDTCRITNPNPRIIAVCDKPYKLMFFTITFRSFTPQPGGLEFRPGQDYYFISRYIGKNATSARGDMLRRIGGRCSTHNMKVVFKVCCNDTEQNHIVDHGPVLQLPGPQTDSATTTTTTPAWLPARTSPPSTRRPTTRHSYKGVHDLYDLHVPSINVKATTKKSDEYDKNKHPNDGVAKNEGLKASAVRLTASSDSGALLALSIACILLRLRPG